jgi:hypothetical protein
MLLNKLHFSHVWDNQSTFSNKRLLHAIYEKLTENFNMFWKTRIFDDSDLSMWSQNSIANLKA